MKIIFGQGNPGTQYSQTRHNTGFIALDTFASFHNAQWHTNKPFAADIAELVVEGEKVLLVKPKSFYNDTGLVARKLIDFYKLNPSQDLLVIHDELVLPFGTIRVRTKGSDAGNNGIKSLNSHLGEQYMRIRVGVWNERRDTVDDAAFVLGRFTNEEYKSLITLCQNTVNKLIYDFIKGNLQPVQYK